MKGKTLDPNNNFRNSDIATAGQVLGYQVHTLQFTHIALWPNISRMRHKLEQNEETKMLLVRADAYKC